MITIKQMPWDIKLFLLAIPFINLINYYLTYPHIRLDWHTIITFLLDTLEGYAAWLLTRYIIIQLEKKLPYENGVIKRIAIQTIITLISGVGLIILLTVFINAIASDKPVPVSFYEYDIFIISIWFFVVNGIYVSMHFYLELKKNKIEKERYMATKEKLHKIFTDGFSVKDGKTEMILPYNDIAGFYIEREYVICLATSGQKILLDQSIDKIQTELPALLFFRLNRQFLLHRQLVKGFQKMENGKLDVLIMPSKNIPSVVSVSRTKAAAFKEWYQQEIENVSV
jgi:hypothetical protein